MNQTLNRSCNITNLIASFQKYRLHLKLKCTFCYIAKIWHGTINTLYNTFHHKKYNNKCRQKNHQHNSCHWYNGISETLRYLSLCTSTEHTAGKLFRTRLVNRHIISIIIRSQHIYICCKILFALFQSIINLRWHFCINFTFPRFIF